LSEDEIPEDNSEIRQDTNEGYEKNVITTTETEVIDLEKTVKADKETEKGDLSTTDSESLIYLNRPPPISLGWMLDLYRTYHKSKFLIHEAEWKGEEGFDGILEKLLSAQQEGYLCVSELTHPEAKSETDGALPRTLEVEFTAGTLRTLEETIKAQELTARKKPGRKQTLDKFRGRFQTERKQPGIYET
jgi:hypothetical protein